MKPTLVPLILACFFLVNHFLKADQLLCLTKEQAIRAKAFLSKHQTFIDWCPICSELTSPTRRFIDIENIQILNLDSPCGKDWFVLKIIGKHSCDNKVYNEFVDLAYAFVLIDGYTRSVGLELDLECEPGIEDIPLLRCSYTDYPFHAIITTNAVHMRAEPDLKSSLLASYNFGQLAKIKERSRESRPLNGIKYLDKLSKNVLDHFYWYKVEIEGQVGWIYGAYIFEMKPLQESITSTFYLSGKTKIYLAKCSSFQQFPLNTYCPQFLVFVDDYGLDEKSRLYFVDPPKGESDHNGLAGLGSIDYKVNFITNKEDAIYIGFEYTCIINLPYQSGYFNRFQVWRCTLNEKTGRYEVEVEYKLETEN